MKERDAEIPRGGGVTRTKELKRNECHKPNGE